MLSDTEIRKSRAGEKPYRLSDSRGLFLLVTPAGTKSWRWKYRHEGKEKVICYGQYPDVPLALARERHAEARKLLATGVDPMAQRKATKDALKAAETAGKATAGDSFQSIAALWLEHWRVGKSRRHVKTTWNRIKSNILPVLGARPIGDIETPELVAMVKGVEARGVGDLAKRTLQTTSQIFRHAVAHGYSKRNPSTEIKPSDILKPHKYVNFARIDAKELPDLLRAIEVYRGTQTTVFALKLLALTFVRTSELIEARWPEIDIEARRWNIPAERMKMDAPHIVPLASQTIELLDQLRKRTGGGELLFPGDRDPRKPMSNNTVLKALERMNYKGRMTGHGWRGIASTYLHQAGFNRDHIETQLAHLTGNAISRAYNHADYLPQRVAMMQHWANFLEQTQRGGKVLPFRSSDVA
jgi:integrase